MRIKFCVGPNRPENDTIQHAHSEWLDQPATLVVLHFFLCEFRSCQAGLPSKTVPACRALPNCSPESRTARMMPDPQGVSASVERPNLPIIPTGTNAIEGYKASMDGDGLRILEHLPQIIERGAESLTPAEKELLKWVGVFYRRPTPGKFMMRIRMPNGFVKSKQLRTIAELSRRIGNSVLDITTRQQIELRGFTLDSIPVIWEKLAGVDLGSLQTGIDNVRNINGCALAGLTPHELFDASPVVQELDRIIVGSEGNPELTNLPRKLNITVTGCLDNCTHG